MKKIMSFSACSIADRQRLKRVTGGGEVFRRHNYGRVTPSAGTVAIRTTDLELDEYRSESKQENLLSRNPNARDTKTHSCPHSRPPTPTRHPHDKLQLDGVVVP